MLSIEVEYVDIVSTWYILLFKLLILTDKFLFLELECIFWLLSYNVFLSWYKIFFLIFPILYEEIGIFFLFFLNCVSTTDFPRVFNLTEWLYLAELILIFSFLEFESNSV